MNIRDLAPRQDERMMVVGSTGSGKTTLATHLIGLYRNVIAIDPKQTLGSGGNRLGKGLAGYAIATTPEELGVVGRRHSLIQYRPDMRHQNPDDWERVYDWIYRRGNTMVYTDEAADVHHYSRAPISYRRCITSGRELGIGMIHATQRPRGIDRRVMSEAERWAVFHIRDEDDRRFIKSRIGEGRLPEYGFWYTRDREPFAPPAVRRLRI
jgi:energy-coupling factor transporter ATP-binding protein EcfA2